jgi:hypothetical protein
MLVSRQQAFSPRHGHNHQHGRRRASEQGTELSNNFQTTADQLGSKTMLELQNIFANYAASLCEELLTVLKNQVQHELSPLHLAMYGLHQEQRQWQNKVIDYLTKALELENELCGKTGPYPKPTKAWTDCNPGPRSHTS